MVFRAFILSKQPIRRPLIFREEVLRRPIFGASRHVFWKKKVGQLDGQRADRHFFGNNLAEGGGFCADEIFAFRDPFKFENPVAVRRPVFHRLISRGIEQLDSGKWQRFVVFVAEGAGNRGLSSQELPE